MGENNDKGQIAVNRDDIQTHLQPRPRMKALHDLLKGLVNFHDGNVKNYVYYIHVAVTTVYMYDMLFCLTCERHHDA